MQTIAILDKNRCTGCGACMNACPSASISMKADVEGFLYPSVDIAKCNNCGKCVTCCPVINSPIVPDNQQEPHVYAAWSLDEKVQFTSTSGGIFTELAKAVLQQKGYVVGAKYNDKYLVEHAMIHQIKEIPLLQQSKYVQSETKYIYKQIKAVLQTKKPVLFVGTPCQCAGLRAFLHRPYENLFLCDFICRGVNSPKIYLKYLEELESKYCSHIKQVWFKNKTYGWNKFCTKIIFDNGQEYLGGRETDPFMYGYIKKNLNLYMRPSCGQCSFKGIRRPVDITLGDFWGVKLNKSNGNADNGVSVVMVATPKGQRLFEMCKASLYWEERQLEEVIPYNRCLLQSAESSMDSKKMFYSLLITSSLCDAINKFKENGLKK